MPNRISRCDIPSLMMTKLAFLFRLSPVSSNSSHHTVDCYVSIYETTYNLFALDIYIIYKGRERDKEEGSVCVWDNLNVTEIWNLIPSERENLKLASEFTQRHIGANRKNIYIAHKEHLWQFNMTHSLISWEKTGSRPRRQHNCLASKKHGGGRYSHSSVGKYSSAWEDGAKDFCGGWRNDSDVDQTKVYIYKGANKKMI